MIKADVSHDFSAFAFRSQLRARLRTMFLRIAESAESRKHLVMVCSLSFSVYGDCSLSGARIINSQKT